MSTKAKFNHAYDFAFEVRSNRDDDEDYTLVDKNMWITVKGFSVRIHVTDEGVVVDIFEKGREDEGAITSTYAFDAECSGEDA